MAAASAVGAASLLRPEIPSNFLFQQLPQTPDFCSREFRLCNRAAFGADPVARSVDAAPMLPGTTVWQRMGQYRTHGRVRLLSIWESTGSSVSLQAGKHGDPYLQWTYRAMNPGESTQGLLDRLFPVSLAASAQSGTSTRTN